MSELLKVNVNDHTEKKGGLTYLSWAWAWAEVLKHDPTATWVAHQYGPQGNEQPCMWIGETAIVHTSVTIKGLRRECLLPVMDNRNNAVKLPDARKISDAIMRCMTKAIAMHGLGLYIYAGEDLPESDDAAPAPPPEQPKGVMGAVKDSLPTLSAEDAEYYKELAHSVGETLKNVGQAGAFDRVELEQLDNDQKLHLWALLDSKTRSALKAEGELRKAA